MFCCCAQQFQVKRYEIHDEPLFWTRIPSECLSFNANLNSKRFPNPIQYVQSAPTVCMVCLYISNELNPANGMEMALVEEPVNAFTAQCYHIFVFLFHFHSAHVSHNLINRLAKTIHTQWYCCVCFLFRIARIVGPVKFKLMGKKLRTSIYVCELFVCANLNSTHFVMRLHIIRSFFGFSIFASFMRDARNETKTKITCFWYGSSTWVMGTVFDTVGRRILWRLPSSASNAMND